MENSIENLLDNMIATTSTDVVAIDNLSGTLDPYVVDNIELDNTINVIEEIVVPDTPAVLGNEQIFVYVTKTEGGSGGVSDYDLLENKPKINDITLSGNKTSSDLGLQDTISDLSTIRSNAEAGKTASDTIDNYGNIVTHNTSEFATSSQGAKADTALQPNDAISELTNDVGYITDSYHDDTKQDVISDLTIIRNGAASGATALQPSALNNYSTISQMNTAINNHHDNTKANISDLEDGTLEVMSAMQAEQDASGNVISTTYATKSEVSAVEDDVDVIEAKIPSAASSSNQLADKNFVNSSINNVAAFYITKDAAGNAFESYAQLSSATTFYSGGVVRVPTRNDYCIVRVDENHDNATTRYIYQNQWEFQYVVNETALTAAQLAAINSGITSSLVNKLNGIESGAEVNVQSDWSQNDSTADDFIKNKPTLFSGNYDDLRNKPTIPTKTSDLTNDSGFITSADVPQELFYCTFGSTTYAQITNALSNNKLPICIYSGFLYTYVATVGSSYRFSTQVANTLYYLIVSSGSNWTTGSTSINNPTITLTQGGVTKGSFTLNQIGNATIPLDAGGGLILRRWS